MPPLRAQIAAKFDEIFTVYVPHVQLKLIENLIQLDLTPDQLDKAYAFMNHCFLDEETGTFQASLRLWLSHISHLANPDLLEAEGPKLHLMIMEGMNNTDTTIQLRYFELACLLANAREDLFLVVRDALK